MEFATQPGISQMEAIWGRIDGHVLWLPIRSSISRISGLGGPSDRPFNSGELSNQLAPALRSEGVHSADANVYCNGIVHSCRQVLSDLCPSMTRSGHS